MNHQLKFDTRQTSMMRFEMRNNDLSDADSLRMNNRLDERSHSNEAREISPQSPTSVFQTDFSGTTSLLQATAYVSIGMNNSEAKDQILQCFLKARPSSSQLWRGSSDLYIEPLCGPYSRSTAPEIPDRILLPEL